MRLPGTAYLEYRLRPHAGGTWVEQRTVFYPRGVAGIAMWVLEYPLHKVAFRCQLASELSGLGRPRHPGASQRRSEDR